MKIAIIRAALMIVIAAVGFAAGFPAGRNSGFSLGSEWALVQAELLAREQGLFLPVRYENGQFRIILKQPRHMYRNASELAARRENDIDRTAGYELQPARKIVSADRQTPDEPARWFLTAAFETHLPDSREVYLADEVPACGENVLTFLAWPRGEFRSRCEGKSDQPVCGCDWLLLAGTQEQ